VEAGSGGEESALTNAVRGVVPIVSLEETAVPADPRTADL